MTTAELALFVSGIALAVSIASLWVNSLKPFGLSVTHDAPTFRLYKITPDFSGSEDGKTWWIPSFDIGVTFYNTGRLPGEVADIRIVAEFDGHRSSQALVFYPKWVVGYSKFQGKGSNRRAWLDEAILRDWYPFMLGGNGEKELHLVLESDRFDYPQRAVMKLTLEVRANNREWVKSATYEQRLHESMFEDKSSYTPYDARLEKYRRLGHQKA